MFISYFVELTENIEQKQDIAGYNLQLAPIFHPEVVSSLLLKLFCIFSSSYMYFPCDLQFLECLYQRKLQIWSQKTS